MKISDPLQTIDFLLFPDLFGCGHEDCPAKNLEIATLPVMEDAIKGSVMALHMSLSLASGLATLARADRHNRST